MAHERIACGSFAYSSVVGMADTPTGLGGQDAGGISICSEGCCMLVNVV